MKALLVFNPKAANGRAIKSLKEIESLLIKHGIKHETILTKEKGYATEILKEINLKEFDTVLSAGGDGTLFETVNGIFKNNKAEKKPAIGIIPIGTGNAFVRDMGLKNGDFKKAIEIISKRKTKKVDAGLFRENGNEYYYLNIIGLGFVSDVAELAHKLKVLGNISYTLAIFAKLISLKPFYSKIIIDGKTFERETIFIEVSNSTYTSNFLIAPEAIVNDGLLDIVILKKTSRLRLIKSFPKIFKGTHIYLPEVETYKAKKITIETETDKILTPDGEILGSSPVEIECLKQAVEVFWK